MASGRTRNTSRISTRKSNGWRERESPEQAAHAYPRPSPIAAGRLGPESAGSREHLRRLCLRDYGGSPRQRLTMLRLRRPCELLTLTNATLFSIATSVGFSDPFSYSQAFKRAFGVPPSVYRERARQSPSSGGVA
ncbi:MAG: AraC family transcriptional regulator [Opitutus sp.]|nr:AraC family transcriptional regulator [Opitutus sp.]